MDVLTIIVISYNTEELTLACLKSVYQQTKGISYQVIVVDNNSSDNSVNLIATNFPQVQLIALTENIGFARANNLAAKQATGQYILLLNPDTVILDNAIGKLVCFAEKHPKSGIWGGKTLHGDYSLNPTSCWDKMTLWSLLCRALQLSSLFPKIKLFTPECFGKWEYNTIKNVDIITGCFFLIYRDLWEQLNGFDNQFFMYGEEVDLCLRAKQKGFQPIFTPDAIIIHYGGASEKQHTQQIMKIMIAKILLINKHWHPLSVPMGIFLLKMYIINKILLYKFIIKLRHNNKHQELLETWSTVWEKRNIWLKADFTII